MPQEKEQRNKEFIKAWKKERLSDRQLQEKFGLSLGGVKGLKARLRKKDSSLYTEKQPESTKREEVGKISRKGVKVQVDKSTSPLVHKRATYYLTPNIIRSIKLKALDKEIDTSTLVREILSEWISR